MNKIKEICKIIKENVINNIYFPNQVKQVIDFQKALVYPLDAQERILRKILRRNKNTEYGKEFNFKNIKNITDYQKKVPIITYEDIEDKIERIKNGKQNILTRNKVIHLVPTSGTTSKPKLIPITRQRIKNYNKEFAIWGLYVLKDHLEITSGKTLYFAGPYYEGKTKGDITYSCISGYLAYRSTWFLKYKIATPLILFNDFNFKRKIRKMAIYAVQENITQLAFTTPIEAIIFFDYLKNSKKKIIREIKKINPKRAEELKNLKEFKPINIWPNISLVNCFKSKTNEMYIDIFLKKLGKNIEVRDPGINASEGRISIGIGKDGVSGVPPINTTFLEYIELGTNKPLTINKLKKNKKYKIVMTTQEGLYRYDIGDIIKVTGFMKKIPLIKFECRNRYLDIAGELAPEVKLTTIMKDTIKECKLKVKHFTIIPCIETSKKPKYEILIDLEDKTTTKKIKEFQKKIDSNLQKGITDYDQMRRYLGRMDKPIISILKKDSYDNFNKKRLVGSGNQKPINIHRDSNFRKNFEIEKTFR